MQTIEIHLFEKCFFSASEYIDYQVKSDYPEFHKTLTEEIESIYEQHASRIYGDSWKTFVTQELILEGYASKQYIHPDSIGIKVSFPNKLSGTGYLTTEFYPCCNEVFRYHNEFTESEKFRIEELLIEYNRLRYDIEKEILEINTGNVTYQEVKDLSPDLFNYIVNLKLESKKTDDNFRIKFISEEEDLEKLKRCLPEIMI